jgi:superfamily II DNA or RNA helicase
MDDLFEAIKQECTRRAWSRGVELVRGDAVSGQTSSVSEVVLQVDARQGPVTPVVTLHLEDEDWECTCRGKEDPCEHIAAAVIALRRARRAGKQLPQPAQPIGRLRYSFRETAAGELDFEREVVQGDQLHLLTSTLDALAKGRVSGPRVSALEQDLTVERVLGPRRRGTLPRDHMAKLLVALAGHEHVVLNGRTVSVSAEPVLPLGRVVDAPGGVRLYIEPDPTLSRHFANGAALCGDTLRVMGAPRLTGRELDELPRGRFFADDDLAELVTQVLPSLRERIPIEIRTERLPTTSESDPPRIHLQVERDGARLSVLPTLVYGSPPKARVDAGRLVHIQGPIPVRDESAERARVQHLQRELSLLPGRRVIYDGEEALEFAERLAGWSGEIEGDAHHRFERLPALEPRLQVEGDGLSLEFTLPEAAGGGGERRVSGDAALAAWRQGDSLVSVGAAGFAPLPADWMARFGHRVADLLAARDEAGNLPACVLPDLGRLCEEIDAPPPPGLRRLRPLFEDFDGIEEAPLPEDLRAELRPYQRHGVNWLCFLRDAGLGALLADDMGLGKTLQALCALQGRALIVMPTSLLHSWSDEIDRFRPGLRYSVYHGPGRRLSLDADVVLTSYAILRLDADRLCDVQWDTVVLDEAQNVKNPESQVAQAAYRLPARWRIALTGTPVENRLEELWSQLHFLDRGLLGGRRDFQERYARPIADGDAEAAARMQERIRPFVLRRLKRVVAPELPPRSEVVLHCELSPSEREVYDSVRAAGVAKVVESLRAGGNVMAALEVLLRLRQAACHSGLVPGQTATESTKVALLTDRLEQAVADGHQALVFSQWTALLDRVEPALRSVGIDFERLDGSTRDRAGVIARFQDREEVPVMLISLKAGGTGLNLTAADHIFLLDPWWNPAVEDQAADRAHRIGQRRPVVVHRLVAQETVEERILELHTRKRALAEVALGAAGSGEGLSKDDLLALFE